MNLEKVKLWTVVIDPHASQAWAAVFIQEPTFYSVHRAILMDIEELARRFADKANDESDSEWLYTLKERSQNALELWETLRGKPAVT